MQPSSPFSGRRATAALLASCLSLGAACSNEPTAQAPAVAIPTAAARPGPPSLPAVVDDLGALVPAGAAYVVELPDVAALAAQLPEAQRGLIALTRPIAERSVAEHLHVDPDVLRDLLDAFDRASLFGDKKSAVLIARFREREPVERFVATLDRVPSESTPGRGVFAHHVTDTRFVWHTGPRILVWATSSEAAARVDAVAAGGKSFATSPRRLPADPAALRFYGDLAALASGEASLAGLADAGSSVRGEIGLARGAIRSRMELALVGDRVPRLGAELEAAAPVLAPRLPEETLAFATFGTKRRAGKTVRDVVRELARAGDGRGGLDDLDSALVATGLGGLDAIDDILGDEITVGVAATPDARLSAAGGDAGALLRGGPHGSAAVFLVAPVRDDARARTLVAALGAALTRAFSTSFKITVTKGAVRMAPIGRAGAPIRLEAHRGFLLFDAGPTPLLDRVARALDAGDHALAATPTFRASAPSLARPSALSVWLDLDRLSRTLGQPNLAPAGGKAGLVRALLTPTPKDGLGIETEGEDGGDVAVVGTLAALGIYGVRRYLGASKAAEAKNAVGAITRAAVSAYEREQPTASPTPVHRLCKSALPVPRVPPPGKKHAPAAGDFESGSDVAGWRCLKFAMSQPHYYQYEYRQGGPYKGPARGGPDPGPDGFEASAEGDVDGNGKTSLFTRVGRVDKARQTIVLSPELFVSDELE